jgi:hypothetical protein
LDGADEIDPGRRRRTTGVTAVDCGSDDSEIDLEAATMWLDRYNGGGMTNRRR